ncbi:RHS repeat-associated core domain-containing protein [Algoriphagus sp. AGSA1]|uniref:RHS repeat domain-containing protein n=1 Tax=Algoriphagus sp. AGSA1 TaxID=2907213 RepID=UPI001F3B9551|nr:RHS repeat-associated core domain-containing protein [Algoriphagus sp. AGSA1]MCE7058077.1 RHS repeat-associated core domain-containing protein [Algoriphagus sp. AGSA1]
METQNAETEEMDFFMVSESRQTEPEHNVTQGGNKVAWLNAGRGRMVGPGRTQVIFAGDSLKLQVHGKYLEDKQQKASAASFMAAGGKERLVTDLNELAVSTQRTGGANPIALLNLADILAKDLQKKEAPEAYLMYALYDQDSNRYEVGKKVLSKNAANQHEVLEENMYISRDGYTPRRTGMETFVVNETSEDVWFDNMMVMSVSSAIVQETHYDPWGLELTGLGFQHGSMKANKYLYNGKELIEDNGIQYYDFGARMYDATIGRWGVVDPLAEKYSPISSYNYALNNPISFIDPDGEEVIPTNSAAFKAILNTLTAGDKAYVQLDKNGMLNRDLINQRQSESGNFQALQTLVNSDRTTEVSVASEYKYKDDNGEIKIGNSKVSYINELEEMYQVYGGAYSKEQLKEMGYKDETRRNGMVGITLLPGEDSPNGNIMVIIGAGQKKEDEAETTAHEAYGHAYFYVVGKDPNHGQNRNKDNQELENQIKERQKEAKKNYVDNN